MRRTRLGLTISGTSTTWMPLAVRAAWSASWVHRASSGIELTRPSEFASARMPWW